MNKRTELETMMVDTISYYDQILNEVMNQIDCYYMTDNEELKKQCINRMETILCEAIYDC